MSLRFRLAKIEAALAPKPQGVVGLAARMRARNFAGPRRQPTNPMALRIAQRAEANR